MLFKRLCLKNCIKKLLSFLETFLCKNVTIVSKTIFDSGYCCSSSLSMFLKLFVAINSNNLATNSQKHSKCTQYQNWKHKV